MNVKNAENVEGGGERKVTAGDLYSLHLCNVSTFKGIIAAASSSLVVIAHCIFSFQSYLLYIQFRN